MKMSAEKKAKLYEAISRTIMDFRIERSKQGATDKEDHALSQLETRIWKRVHAALGIEGPV